MYQQIQAVGSGMSTMSCLLPLVGFLIEGARAAPAPQFTTDEPYLSLHPQPRPTHNPDDEFFHLWPSMGAGEPSLSLHPEPRPTHNPDDEFFHLWPSMGASEPLTTTQAVVSSDTQLPPIMPFIPVPPTAYPVPHDRYLVTTMAEEHSPPHHTETTVPVFTIETSPPEAMVTTLAQAPQDTTKTRGTKPPTAYPPPHDPFMVTTMAAEKSEAHHTTEMRGPIFTTQAIPPEEGMVTTMAQDNKPTFTQRGIHTPGPIFTPLTTTESPFPTDRVNLTGVTYEVTTLTTVVRHRKTLGTPTTTMRTQAMEEPTGV